MLHDVLFPSFYFLFLSMYTKTILSSYYAN